MSVAVVYTGDHYIVDVLAGVALGRLCWLWTNKRNGMGKPRATHKQIDSDYDDH
jgi:membrane-associated phospholipid phosphatase